LTKESDRRVGRRGGATVTGGGTAKIGNGIVDIEAPGDNQNVAFQSGGTGGLDIGVLGSARTGTVSGFGQNVRRSSTLPLLALRAATTRLDVVDGHVCSRRSGRIDHGPSTGEV
jgi:hypothetical protein